MSSALSALPAPGATPAAAPAAASAPTFASAPAPAPAPALAPTSAPVSVTVSVPVSVPVSFPASGRGPQRIACLSTEVVETLYLLGEQDRIAGISGFTVHPPQARRDKPKISGYSTGQLERILAVKPDLVLAFSDMQAQLAADLVRAGLEVHVFNQRDLAGMLAMVRSLGALCQTTEALAAAERLATKLQARIDAAQAQGAGLGPRPRVWFEEWHEPLISGVRWVAELIALAGGEDLFPELSVHPDAKSRIVADPLAVVARAPDVIVGSWCGRKFVPQQVMDRPGWAEVPAVRTGFVREIKSPDILAPGPTLLLRGLPQLQALFAEWRAHRGGEDSAGQHTQRDMTGGAA